MIWEREPTAKVHNEPNNKPEVNPGKQAIPKMIQPRYTEREMGSMLAIDVIELTPRFVATAVKEGAATLVFNFVFCSDSEEKIDSLPRGLVGFFI
ncbi:hypothetical protein [Legionella moravica]|uniref:hypothetical protein n=1 Tax=Legionella moravica TaxID=39962 RepID=UPI00048ABC6D|nr:hypothetical protein [Legionella moravica]